MIELIGALTGFFGGIVPDIIGIFRDQKDKQHELAVMKLQMQQQAAGHTAKLEEVNVQADIAESSAIYKTYSTGIKWVDAYNGTVRPTLAYSFFLLYLFVKVSLYTSLDLSLPWSVQAFWSETDQAFLVGVMAYYFGQRGMKKALGR